MIFFSNYHMLFSINFHAPTVCVKLDLLRDVDEIKTLRSGVDVVARVRYLTSLFGGLFSYANTPLARWSTGVVSYT
jgi:hypothetical protein